MNSRQDIIDRILRAAGIDSEHINIPDPAVSHGREGLMWHQWLVWLSGDSWVVFTPYTFHGISKRRLSYLATHPNVMLNSNRFDSWVIAVNKYSSKNIDKVIEAILVSEQKFNDRQEAIG
jgi:hypothetical protein